MSAFLTREDLEPFDESFWIIFRRIVKTLTQSEIFFFDLYDAVQVFPDFRLNREIVPLWINI